MKIKFIGNEIGDRAYIDFADKKRMFDIKDWLYQLENALKGSGK